MANFACGKCGREDLETGEFTIWVSPGLVTMYRWACESCHEDMKEMYENEESDRDSA